MGKKYSCVSEKKTSSPAPTNYSPPTPYLSKYFFEASLKNPVCVHFWQVCGQALKGVGDVWEAESQALWLLTINAIRLLTQYTTHKSHLPTHVTIAHFLYVLCCLKWKISFQCLEDVICFHLLLLQQSRIALQITIFTLGSLAVVSKWSLKHGHRLSMPELTDIYVTSPSRNTAIRGHP